MEMEILELFVSLSVVDLHISKKEGLKVKKQEGES